MKEKKILYPKENNRELVNELKGRIRRLDKDNKKLKSDIKTLQRAFDKSIEFIQNRFRTKSIKEIMDIINGTD